MSNTENIKHQLVKSINKLVEQIDSNAHTKNNLDDIFQATSVIGLRNMEAWEKFFMSSYSNALYFRSQKNKWKFWYSNNAALNWLDLVNHDGFKREQFILSNQSTAPNSFFFTLFLRRLNDWVPQIRKVAREKIYFLAIQSNPDDVTAALASTLPYWHQWNRLEIECRQIINKIIHIESIKHRLINIILNEETGPVGEIFSQSTRSDAFDAHIFDIAQFAAQPSVRARAYRILLNKKIIWVTGEKWVWKDIRYCIGHTIRVFDERPLLLDAPTIKVLHLIVEDKSTIVRRVGVDHLLRKLDSIEKEEIEILKTLARDRFPSIAERAEFALKQIANVT